MPIIILLIIFAIYGGVNLHKTYTKNTKPYTKEELDKMLSEMVGKSDKEARKIIRKYRK